MDVVHPTIRGRGSAANPTNRFEALAFERDDQVEPDPELGFADDAPPATVFLKDTARSIIATNDSPDVGFSHSINPYRGCEHGCVYCYARPTHEYLGFSAGLDFESRILVKTDAPMLLRRELAARSYQPVGLAISGVTDCYQPVERKLRLTRQCLEVLVECRNPCTLITKNHLITRDIDLLRELAATCGVRAMISVTTLDANLTRIMEPRTSTPARRLAVIEALAQAGIPVGVMMAPVVPGITDHEMPRVLQAAADAGAKVAGYVTLRLPHGVAPMFDDWLARHFPDRRDKVLNRIRELRGGKLYDAKFGERMRGVGVWAEQFRTMFELARRRSGLTGMFPEVRLDLFRPPAGPQMTLW